MGINFPALAVSRALDLDLPEPAYIPGKYITAWGYLLHWKDRLLRKKDIESYRCSESDLKELVVDPLTTLSHAWQQVMNHMSSGLLHLSNHWKRVEVECPRVTLRGPTLLLYFD